MLACREQHVELARVRLVADRRGEGEQLVGRVTHRRHDDDQRRAGRVLAGDAQRDPSDALRVGHGRAAELLDDEGAWHPADSSSGSDTLRRTSIPRARVGWHLPQPEVDHVLRSGGSTTDRADRRWRARRREMVLVADDGNRFRAFRARAAEPTGAGMIILPDVRGLHPYYEDLAQRFAEHGIDAVAIDYFGRTAGPEHRDGSFDFASHVPRTTFAGLSADIRAAAAYLRSAEGGERQGRLQRRLLLRRSPRVPQRDPRRRPRRRRRVLRLARRRRLATTRLPRPTSPSR